MADSQVLQVEVALESDPRDKPVEEGIPIVDAEQSERETGGSDLSGTSTIASSKEVWK